MRRRGTAWVSSYGNGLIHIDSYGSRLGDATSLLPSHNLSAVAMDPADGSVWTGMMWGVGFARVFGSHAGNAWWADASGSKFCGTCREWAAVSNIQSSGSGSGRKMVLSFRPFTSKKVNYAGAVGIYSGP